MPSINFSDWLEAQEAYVASDSAANTTVTGQTSFANTTPTFLIDVPSGRTIYPRFVNLTQAGTVAGGDITAFIEIDNADRYASVGTSETILSVGRAVNTSLCAVYSGATANSGYGARIWGAEDIVPDVAAVPLREYGPLWKNEMPYRIHGPGAFLVFTFAATTGPTWLWSLGWSECATADAR